MPTGVDKALSMIDDQILSIKTNIDDVLADAFKPTSADLQIMEQHLAELYRKLAALQTARKLQESIVEDVMVIAIDEFLKQLKGKFRMVSWRPQIITFLGGSKVTIYMPYYARQCAPTKGISPHLWLLGIIQHMTPAVASMTAMLSAALSSFKEAENVLAEWGIMLNSKTIRLVSKAFAAKARAGQESTDTISGDLSGSIESAGISRILVSTDGGRIRIRRKKTGPKGKTGRDRYHADWREPKLIIIIVLGKDGRQDTTFPPIIDATMSGPDAAFSLLASYLNRLCLKSTKLSFVSDGAKWIWLRAQKLFKNLNVIISDVTFILDYYHAVQHLNEMVSFKRGWETSEKKRWVQKMKKWLIEGRSEEVIASMKQMTKGTHSKDLRRELKYFLSHTDRLGYKDAREAGLSIGSGAVESAIRRVINLRLKGPGTIWNEEGAQEMLMLRSFFKAGRWSQLERWAFTPQTVGA